MIENVGMHNNQSYVKSAETNTIQSHIIKLTFFEIDGFGWNFIYIKVLLYGYSIIIIIYKVYQNINSCLKEYL